MGRDPMQEHLWYQIATHPIRQSRRRASADTAQTNEAAAGALPALIRTFPLLGLMTSLIAVRNPWSRLFKSFQPPR